MSSADLADVVRKKNLGQYFTGRRVGRLLAALAQAQSAQSIIDPMVGSGDLLAACLEVGCKPETLVGLDLDPLAVAEARAALGDMPRVDLTPGDAFAAALPPSQFDLVITNPPYIRSQSKKEVDGLVVPSARSVRAHLIEQIAGRVELSESDRALFLRAAKTYPDTADIAVPAWILSAALVREDGYLAVVVPQAWLSRNYAHAVRGLLDDCFDVEFVIEDGDTSWFDDAQVRTHLVVARRRAISDNHKHSLVVARATRALDTGGSLVGSYRSEHDVVAALRRVESLESVEVTRGLLAKVSNGISFATEGRGGKVASSISVAIGIGSDSVTRTIEAYGWSVGQGLRTGANDFFYLTETDRIRSATRWGGIELDVPNECVEPAVRRQTDLGESLRVTAETPLTSRVLNLRGWVTPSDSLRMGIPGMHVLPEGVSRWIEHVATSPLSDSGVSRTFPKLVAVATNAKKDSEGRPLTFWYQLPPLAPRHRPRIFMPRVCGGRPFAYLNVAGALIDANFSSFWPTKEDAIPAEALFAILNSTWTWANLEVSSTVLGGGALKVEATDLRRLPLPEFNESATSKLVELGKQLRWRADDKVLGEIDSVISESIAGTTETALYRRLGDVATQALRRRTGSKLAGGRKMKPRLVGAEFRL